MNFGHVIKFNKTEKKLTLFGGGSSEDLVAGGNSGSGSFSTSESFRFCSLPLAMIVKKIHPPRV